MPLQLEVLEDRCCPSDLGPPTYHGGLVLTTPKVAEVFVGSVPPAIGNVAAVAVHDYAHAYLGPFGVSANGQIDGTLNLPSQSLSNVQVQQILGFLIDQHILPAPDGQSQMYLVVSDQKVTGATSPDFHGFFTHNGVQVPYAVAFADSSNDTVGVSHELVETITDPLQSGWYAQQSQTGEVADQGSTTHFEGFEVVVPSSPSGGLVQQGAPFSPLPSSASTSTPILTFLQSALAAVTQRLTQDINLFFQGYASGNFQQVAFAQQDLTAIFPVYQFLSYEVSLFQNLNAQGYTF